MSPTIPVACGPARARLRAASPRARAADGNATAFATARPREPVRPSSPHCPDPRPRAQPRSGHGASLRAATPRGAAAPSPHCPDPRPRARPRPGHGNGQRSLTPSASPESRAPATHTAYGPSRSPPPPYLAYRSITFPRARWQTAQNGTRLRENITQSAWGR